MPQWAMFKENHMNQTKFQAGQRVTFNGGFHGVVVRYYSEGMIEVRGDRGMVCIPEQDAKAV